MTIIDILVATAVMLAVLGGVFGMLGPAQAPSQAQPETSDVHQRLRVAVDAISRDLMMAGSGMPEAVPALMPDRHAITAVYVPWGASASASHTYYLKNDPASGAPQLMHYDGKVTDSPVVDHVVKLEFEYFDGVGAPLDPTASAAGEDWIRIRRIRVLVRVEASLDSMRGPSGRLFARAGTSTALQRYVPDRELQFDVSIRSTSDDR